MEAIPVIDSTHLVPLPGGRTVMVGAPPEALKVLVLWEFPSPSVVVVPPNPLFANGINQASFEFLLYNHLFVMNGLRDRVPFLVVCDPEQQAPLESLIRHMLRGPDDEEMARWRTPASHRRQLLRETTVVSGAVAAAELSTLARVIPFRSGCAELPDGTVIEELAGGEVRIACGAEAVRVPRRAQRRSQLPLYFADVERPAEGPRFGLQVIGSASGFSGAEWSSCYLIWINGQPLVVDGTPYLDEHLRRLGIEEEQILGYLITHNHEDHANMIGQLVSHRPVTVLTSGPIMATLVPRLSAILGCPEEAARRLFRWVPLHPELDDFGAPLHWFGAEIRTWYSVHTIPTLGVDISMEGRHIRMPGDTLWGRQLEPLLKEGVISPRRCHFIQRTYEGADVIVADAGGGPIHPDPQEVQELLRQRSGCRMMVTHVSETARQYLPPADPGTEVVLLPREVRTADEAMALFGSPTLRRVPERWLLALLHGGTAVEPGEAVAAEGSCAYFVLSGCCALRAGGCFDLTIQRGDLFHASLLPGAHAPELRPTAPWTRLLRIPEPLYRAFLADTGLGGVLERLYRTRRWWRAVIGEEPRLDVLVELAQLSRERRYRPGAEIARQGHPATRFYMVTEGQVEVLHGAPGEPRSMGVHGPGYHFGEITLLGEAERLTTVRARTPVTVLELPGRAFRRLLMQIPLARYRLCRTAARSAEDLRRTGEAPGRGC